MNQSKYTKSNLRKDLIGLASIAICAFVTFLTVFACAALLSLRLSLGLTMMLIISVAVTAVARKEVKVVARWAARSYHARAR